MNTFQIFSKLVHDRYNAKRLAQAANAEQRQKLLGLLEKKQDAALETLSVEEIRKQLAALE